MSRALAPLSSLLLVLCTLATPAATAQVKGPVQYLAQKEKMHNVSNPNLLTRPSPLCHGEMIYVLDGIGFGKQIFGHVYNATTGAGVASRELEFDRKVKDSFKYLEFFMAGDNPAILFRQWDKKSGKVTLYVERYDPLTFQPIGRPTEVGVIPFDAKSYAGYGPIMEVENSPDGSKILFYFDRIKVQEVQLVMCWVTDTDLNSIWSGIYRVPAQSAGFHKEMHFSDEGAVYLAVNAVLLNESNVKEKADGSVKVQVSHSLRGMTKSYFKMHHEEFRFWDGTLPGGKQLENGLLTVKGSKVYFGGLLIPEGGGKGGREWVFAHMDEDFKPVDIERLPVPSQKMDDLSLSSFVVDDEGGGFFVGRRAKDNETVVTAFDANGTERWNNSVKWKSYYRVAAFCRDGRLHLLGKATGDQSGIEGSTEYNHKSGSWVVPAIGMFTETGRFLPQDLLGFDVNGAKRHLDMAVPDHKSIVTHGYFVDHSYDKKKPGLLLVKVQ
jgi:hypothetical protein